LRSARKDSWKASKIVVIPGKRADVVPFEKLVEELKKANKSAGTCG
jgi:hypothetical protein